VARMRNRPVENKWIGQRISDPDIDLAALARAPGALGFGPVDDVKNSGSFYPATSCINRINAAETSMNFRSLSSRPT